MVAALRALNVPAQTVAGLDAGKTRLWLAAPMEAMGQPWQRPNGPDGWPEEMDYWITPQGLAARIEWALLLAGRMGGDQRPQDLARTALGALVDTRMLQVVGAAESRREGIALVLASPEFNRR